MQENRRESPAATTRNRLESSALRLPITPGLSGQGRGEAAHVTRRPWPGSTVRNGRPFSFLRATRGKEVPMRLLAGSRRKGARDLHAPARA